MYVQKSEGPGSIAALVPGAALSHPPTIGSNAPIRDVNHITSGARPIPAMSGGCGCGNADQPQADGGMKRFLGMLLVPGALIGGLYLLTRDR